MYDTYLILPLEIVLKFAISVISIEIDNTEHISKESY